MATGDYQMFRPSDSAFMNPGELTESWRTMALERATENSNLERLYTTLEQEQNQFEASLAEQRYEFDESQGFKYNELGYNYEQLAYLYDKLGKDYDVQSRQVGVSESEEDRAGLTDWIKVGAGVLGVGKDLYDWWDTDNVSNLAGVDDALSSFFDFS